MNYLLELGITDNELKEILEVNPEIDEKLIQILKLIGCDTDTIYNIITTNPYYLLRSYTDVIKLIDKLNNLGIERLDITFDNNPYLLNKDAFEIDNLIKEKGLENIIDLIDSGMVE